MVLFITIAIWEFVVYFQSFSSGLKVRKVPNIFGQMLFYFIFEATCLEENLFTWH